MATATQTTPALRVGKLVRLQQQLENLRGASRGAGERARELSTAKQATNEQIRRSRDFHAQSPSYRTVERAVATSGTVTEHRERVYVDPQLERELEQIEAALASVRQRQAAIDGELQPLARLVGRLEDHAKASGVDLRYLPLAEEPRRSTDGAATIDELDAIRGQLRQAQTARRDIADAPLSEREVADRIDAGLEAAAASYNPHVSSLVVPGASGGVRLFTNTAEGVTDAFGMVAALHSHLRELQAYEAATNREPLRKVLLAATRAEAESRGGWGLPTAARRARVAELDAEVYRLEIEEERTVEALEAAGVAVARRADASPAAVLAA